MSPPPIKVLIVGGGIAGLALANALEKADVKIEYLLLESRDTIAPQVGASIGLAPNGSRILDQLGCYEDIEALLEPVRSAGLHDKDGIDLIEGRSDAFQLIGARTNYPVAFLERRSVLQILAKHVKRGECIFTKKRVQKISQDPQGATVFCTDGTQYRGDIVVGADGVNSTVRREMWRVAENKQTFDVKKESATMKAEYKCLFGISSPIPGLAAGSYDVTHAKNVSTLVITGKGGKVYWFLFALMDLVYQSHEIPHFTPEDASSFASKYRELPILPNGLVKMQHLWASHQNANLVALEEADFQHWTAGRIVCLGDSIHKMTPNSGSGGMLAIESAAALANSLYLLAKSKSNSPPDTIEINAALKNFEKGMKPRATQAIKGAGEVTRIQALKGVKEKIIAHYIIPFAGDYVVDQSCESWVGGRKIDFLPPPTRSLTGTMPFNPSQGIGKQESRWSRILRALPILIMGYACFHIMFGMVPYEEGFKILEEGMYRWGEGKELKLLERFYRISFFDEQARPGTLVTTPSQVGADEGSWFQMFSFLADFGVWYAILLIEAARRGNQFGVLRFALLWGMFNLHGIGVFAPIYNFTHYILTPLSSFKASDMRLTDLTYTKTILPIMGLVYYTTYLDSYLSPVLPHRHIAAWLWRMFPIGICALQYLSARFLLTRTIKEDRLNNATRDLPTIRRIILILGGFSTGVWLYTLWFSTSSIFEIFIPVPFSSSQTTFEEAIREMLKWDQVFFVLANIFWVWMMFWDLKRAGMVNVNWLVIFLSPVLGSVLVGNGGMVGLAWLVREEILAGRRHRDAVVEGGVGVVARKECGVVNGNMNGHVEKGRSVRFGVSREEKLW